jgi:hypothetical protein
MSEQSLQSLDACSAPTASEASGMAMVVRCEAVQADRPRRLVDRRCGESSCCRASPAELVKTSSSGPFPSTCFASSSTTNRGTGTSRRLWFFGVSSSMARSGIASATSIRPAQDPDASPVRRASRPSAGPCRQRPRLGPIPTTGSLTYAPVYE